jgi:hypothetical protein
VIPARGLQAEWREWLPAIGCGLLLLLLLWRLWRLVVLHRARGRQRRAITGAGVEWLSDVLVPDGQGGQLHVDYLLLTARCILIIDIRDITGNIFGSDQMDNWTVMNGSFRDTFRNPLHALYDRIGGVKSATGDVPVEGRVLFTRRGRFPKGLPRWTLGVDSLQGEFTPEDARAAADLGGPLREAWRRLAQRCESAPARNGSRWLKDLLTG